MFTDLKPYPEYADSGITWLGQLPAHWRVHRVKSLLREQVTKDHPGESLLAATQSRGVIRKSDYGTRTVTAQKDLHLLKLVEVGDFVISLRSFQGGIERAFDRGIISPAYTVLHLHNIQQRNYLTLLFKSRPFVDGLTLCITGIREGQNVDYARLSRDGLPVPPADEQASIVKYLGHANARINRAIVAKRKLIALLEEQKQAIINQAVTRGLDPDVTFRHSGVEVPREMPSHWRVVALKRMLRALVDCEHKTAPYFEGGVHHVVRTTAVRNGRLEWAGTYTTSAEAFGIWTQRGMPEAGDVVFTREAPAGEACLVPPGHNVCLGQRTVLMKLDRANFDAQFLVHQIYVGPARQRIQVATQGSTVGHFNMDDIGWMPVFVPPLAEQCQITRHIAESTQVLEVTIGRAAQEIDLLREFRTRLTADVVTGQLDVREAAAQLPELDLADLVSDVGTDEQDLDAELAENLEEVDA